MSSDTSIHGIFLSLKSVSGDLQSRSFRWWVGFFIVTGLSLSVIVGLLIVALSSNSELGLQAVVGTVVIASVFQVAYKLQKRSVAAGRLKRMEGRTICAAVFLVTSAEVVLWALSAIPTVARAFSVAVILGGFLVAVIMLLILEGYPILKVRGSAGYIAEAGLLIVFSMAYMTVISSWISPFLATKINVGPILSPPSLAYPLGTTSLGQDLLSRVLTGGSIMLQVAILSVIVCFSIGVPLALAASYRGGVADRAASLVMDSIYAFPGLVLAIAISAMLGPGVINMALSIAVVYIPSYFRVVRSQVLTIKELPYVEAAVAMGARSRDIVFRYILPNLLPSAVVVMTINFADAILTEAGLTFVGLGLPVNVPDWGWDLTFGRTQLITGAWWVIAFPGLMIVLLALGFTLAGEGLNEVLTPKLKE
ncbi:MAG: hypothetical protein C4K47_01810 [Candidatus Thorarchaeota archaeon]|nr:MAG: hypothetical protein C4K47_01810 [Candidatus Thorarchaeota archaeon]